MEVFAAITGSLTIASMFNNCVTCFEYIQLGRTFGRDYELFQLRLDAARVRLARWGEAVNIHQDSRFLSPVDVNDPKLKFAGELFHGIAGCIQTVANGSKRHATQETFAGREASLALFAPDEMTSVGRTLHNRAAGIASRRQHVTGVLERMSWALYERKAFDWTLSTITELLGSLEGIFPVDSIRQQLARRDVEELADNPAALTVLSQSAADADPLVHELTRGKLSLIHGKNHADTIEAKDETDVQVGHHYNQQILAGGFGFEDRTTNSAGEIRSGGTSKVLIGHRIG